MTKSFFFCTLQFGTAQEYVKNYTKIYFCIDPSHKKLSKFLVIIENKHLTQKLFLGLSHLLLDDLVINQVNST